MISKTYSIANDTLYGVVNEGLLKVEIEKTNITIAIDSIDSLADDLVITFRANISASEETTLDGVVAAHNGFLKSQDEDLNDVVDELKVNDRIKIDVVGTLLFLVIYKKVLKAFQ